jgi:hypothetical protein
MRDQLHPLNLKPWEALPKMFQCRRLGPDVLAYEGSPLHSAIPNDAVEESAGGEL